MQNSQRLMLDLDIWMIDLKKSSDDSEISE
jgi:hypothetical protein